MAIVVASALCDTATEFARRRGLNGTRVDYSSDGRTFTTYLHNRAIDLGSRTDIMKRGKVVSSTYFLPSYDDSEIGP